MRRLFALALAAAALLVAQGLDSHSGWQYFRELSAVPGTGLATLTLDSEILVNTREDDGDLRLFDADGNPVSYRLRVLSGERSAESFATNELGRVTKGDSSEIILDLGVDPPEHHQVQVDTEGPRFRRQVSVFGSDDAEQWTPLTENGMILRLTGNGASAAINRVRYPPSELRYVRISVARDPQVDSGPPVIETAAVQRAIVTLGEQQETAALSVSREAIAEGDHSGSRYTIDLPGPMPLHALQFKTSSGAFHRNYQLLSIMGNNVTPFPLSGGRIIRLEGNPSNVVEIRFQEAQARQLQLTVVDNGDAPLDVIDPVVLTASRQLVADLDAPQPWRLYYGNPDASAPDDTLVVELPLDDSVPRFELGPEVLNPAYQEPSPPLYEQAPWLIYVLTGVASLALLAILRSLVFDVK